MIPTADFDSIRDLDLAAIKLKLMHVPSGEGWSAAKADAVEHEYRRFLYLMKQFPQEPTVPLVDVDTFWHYHILDTVRYARDCQSVFGYFLHHHPYVGIDSAEDGAARERSATRMAELYEASFGEDYNAAAERMSRAGHAPASNAAYCPATAADAYCSTVAKAAYCSVAAAKAYCSATVAAAYCSATATDGTGAAALKQPGFTTVRDAYCSTTAGAAYCSVTAPAYCSVTAAPANRSATSAAAYCSATVAAARAAYCSITAPGDSARSAQAA